MQTKLYKQRIIFLKSIVFLLANCPVLGTMTPKSSLRAKFWIIMNFPEKKTVLSCKPQRYQYKKKTCNISEY